MLFCSNSFAQNVGIGTNNPSARLQVNQNSTVGIPGLLIKDSAASKAGIMQFQNNNSSHHIRLTGWTLNNTSSNSFLDFNSDSLFIGTFRGNGNVGIGNYTPAERLDVTGNINVTGTIKANDIAGQAGHVLTTDHNGNLAWNYNTAMYPYFMAFKTPASTSWTVPAGVTKIFVEGWGGGGGSSIVTNDK